MVRLLWQGQLTELRTSATLAAWRWRQQWFLVLLTAFGMLMATTLICVLPLFSSVMTTAGLRTTLRIAPDNAKIEVRLGLSALSSSSIVAATGQISSLFTRDLGSDVATTGDLSRQIEVPNWLIAGTADQVILHGASMRVASSHVQVLQGRLPSDASVAVQEVALTPSAATYMHVHPGSDISLLGQAQAISASFGPQTYAQTLTLHVVGIFQTLSSDSYWQGQTFQEPAPLPRSTPAPFHVLISSGPFLNWVDTLAQNYQSTGGISFAPSSACFLTYALSSEQLNSARLDTLINHLGQLQADIAQMQSANSTSVYSSGTAFPYIVGVSISGAALHDPLGPELLDAFQNEVQLGQTTMLILTLQIAGLVLFFTSMLAQVQVERQAPALALLRSRGASGWQLLATLFIQGLLLCLFAGCLAPLLALEVVRLVAPLLLPSTARDALNVLPSTFAALLSDVGFYSLVALCVVLGTQLLAFMMALRGNILTLRREAARSTRGSLWLYLRLDLVLAVIGLGSYGFSFYTQNTQQLLSTQAQLLLLTPLNLLAPLFLLLACVLFFLRLFPDLLRSLLRLIAGRRDAPSLLAMAQIARAPRQPARLALLLGLALAFAIFTLIFAASQEQRAQDLAMYQAGADFSGYLPLNFQTSNVVAQKQLLARYQAIPGVISISTGYAGQANIQVNPGSPNEFLRPLQVRAVDPQTFTQTVSWAPQVSAQTPRDLLAQLVALRPQARRQNIVPAILSASAWQLLHLHSGEIFHIFTTDGTHDGINYLAVTSIAHVPPANESIESGMLVDLQTLQIAYTHQKMTLPANYIWLQSRTDSPDLALIRRALTSAPLALNNLADQQALAQVNATNPLILSLLATLSVGVCTVLLLALLANLLLPMLNMRARLTTFAFLRALGTVPSQVLRILIWEQGVVLITALFLGALLGFPLAWLAVPALIVNSIPANSASSGGANAVYLTQGLLPARIVLPSSLWLALALLLILGILALFFLNRMVLRLALGQQIRLNED